MSAKGEISIRLQSEGLKTITTIRCLWEGLRVCYWGPSCRPPKPIPGIVWLHNRHRCSPALIVCLSLQIILLAAYTTTARQQRRAPATRPPGNIVSTTAQVTISAGRLDGILLVPVLGCTAGRLLPAGSAISCYSSLILLRTIFAALP
jgi:hypothetical protein